MAEEIKFPFEPCEEVKAAFRQAEGLERTLRLVMGALLQAGSEIPNPWSVVRKKHPELVQYTKLSYNKMSETFDLKVDNWVDLSNKD